MSKSAKDKAREGGHSGNCIMGGGLYCPKCRPDAAKVVPQVKRSEWRFDGTGYERPARDGGVYRVSRSEQRFWPGWRAWSISPGGKWERMRMWKLDGSGPLSEWLDYVDSIEDAQPSEGAES